ncbi:MULTISPECIES: hypothetical protein [Streptomyces]|uniref:hypothetical protein n=1 Tax=Streptomyces decoyicus TaxID=249567 RepID=UPI0030BBA658|nr:hypothetical protein OG532_16535 [Streptomyces decoyicus]
MVSVSRARLDIGTLLVARVTADGVDIVADDRHITEAMATAIADTLNNVDQCRFGSADCVPVLPQQRQAT